MNCILHGIASNAQGSWEDMFDDFLWEIDSLVQSVQPVDLLFLAFDGVVPFAKWKEGKNRKYQKLKEALEK